MFSLSPSLSTISDELFLSTLMSFGKLIVTLPSGVSALPCSVNTFKVSVNPALSTSPSPTFFGCELIIASFFLRRVIASFKACCCTFLTLSRSNDAPYKNALSVNPPALIITSDNRSPSLNV